MCEAMGAGAGLGIMGGILKGVDAKATLEKRADSEEINALLARKAAQDAIQRGEQDAEKVDLEGAQAEGKQRAGYGAMGVVVGEGSAGLTERDTAQMTKVSEDIVRNNAHREAWGLERQADQFLRQAKLDREEADHAILTGILGGGLSGLGSSLSTYRYTPDSQAPSVEGGS